MTEGVVTLLPRMGTLNLQHKFACLKTKEREERGGEEGREGRDCVLMMEVNRLLDSRVGLKEASST